ncbi:MAG TPA: hypothetical protein VNO30_46965 [Kofleriaceae bacterium]|nr:hypothetical protein [Kofleriaceae bacterium]
MKATREPPGSLPFAGGGGSAFSTTVVAVIANSTVPGLSGGAARS